MKKLYNYLRYRQSLYFLSFLFIGLFNIVLYLYDISSKAIQYATLLCFFILVVYFIIDYYHFYKKQKQLSYILNFKETYISDLSLPDNQIEQLYQDLLKKIDDLHHQLEGKNEQDYHNMIDYFTLWVHQIKTPISALHLLIQSEDTSSNDLLIQVLRIEQYVEMVLHYIKVDHMSSDLKLKYYSLENIVNAVVKKQATFFIHQKIQLNLEPISLNILTDEKWITFVIEQIVSNALKYTKQGYIHIYVRDETLYIEDTGIGIHEEDLPRLFERGFTGYNGRLDKKASGLGLYLCYEIIQNLGYKINIQSQFGKGTCVSIDFHVEKLQVE